jgi:hypothetical protein
MSHVTFINNPFKNAINAIVAAFDLTQFRNSNYLTTWPLGRCFKLRCIPSIVLNYVVKSMLTIRKLIAPPTRGFPITIKRGPSPFINLYLELYLKLFGVQLGLQDH